MGAVEGPLHGLPGEQLGGPFPVDCSAVLTPADSVAPKVDDSVVPKVDDSVVRDWLRLDARSAPADCLGGSRVGWRAERRRVLPAWQHSAGLPVGYSNGPCSASPACQEEPV